MAIKAATDVFCAGYPIVMLILSIVSGMECMTGVSRLSSQRTMAVSVYESCRSGWICSISVGISLACPMVEGTEMYSMALSLYLKLLKCSSPRALGNSFMFSRI